MRWRGVSHVEFAVLDYDDSIAFYDALFGWLGYDSFSSLNMEYQSIYYFTRYINPHSYIGIQPARTGGRLTHSDQAVGVNHIALWARSRKEVDRFHREFLVRRDVPVTDEPKDYPQYWPGYYAVFFDDPINGIHWELAWVPKVPSPRQVWGVLSRTSRFRQESDRPGQYGAWRHLAGEANPASALGSSQPAPAANTLLISSCRNRNRPSSSFLRRIQLVTSALHLLVLHERQQGTTLVTT